VYSAQSLAKPVWPTFVLLNLNSLQDGHSTQSYDSDSNDLIGWPSRPQRNFMHWGVLISLSSLLSITWLARAPLFGSVNCIAPRYFYPNPQSRFKTSGSPKSRARLRFPGRNPKGKPITEVRVSEHKVLNVHDELCFLIKYRLNNDSCIARVRLLKLSYHFIIFC